MATPGHKEYDAALHPSELIAQRARGKIIAAIAADWDIAEKTMYQWRMKYKEFAHAWDVGDAKYKRWLDEKLWASAHDEKANGQVLKILAITHGYYTDKLSDKARKRAGFATDPEKAIAEAVENGEMTAKEYNDFSSGLTQKFERDHAIKLSDALADLTKNNK